MSVAPRGCSSSSWSACARDGAGTGCGQRSMSTAVFNLSLGYPHSPNPVKLWRFRASLRTRALTLTVLRYLHSLISSLIAGWLPVLTRCRASTNSVRHQVRLPAT